MELLDNNPHPLFIGENPTGVYVAVSWVQSRSSRLSGNASVCALRDDLNNSKEGDRSSSSYRKSFHLFISDEKPLRSRLSFKIQRLNSRQALLGALKRVLVREREAQEEGKEERPSSRVSRASRTPRSAPQKADYEGHRRKITAILIHHLLSHISSTLSQHPGPNNHLKIT